MSLRNRLQRLEQVSMPRIDPAHLEIVRNLTPEKMDALDEALIAGELADPGYPVPDTLADQRRVMAEVLETLDRPPADWQALLDDFGVWNRDTYRQHTIARYRDLTGDGPRPDGLHKPENHPAEAVAER